MTYLPNKSVPYTNTHTLSLSLYVMLLLVENTTVILKSRVIMNDVFSGTNSQTSYRKRSRRVSSII